MFLFPLFYSPMIRTSIQSSMLWNVFLLFLLLQINIFCFSKKGKQRTNKNSTIRHRSRDRSVNRNMDQLIIHYPANFMTLDSDWRSAAPLYSEAVVVQNISDWRHLAQDGEDMWVYKNFFFGMTEGIILESGALDGMTFSTTYMFEKYLNWTSIHVEADPRNFAKLLEARKESINIQAGLCTESRPLHYASRGEVGGFVELMSDSFMSYWFDDLYNNTVEIYKLPLVLCLPMKSLLHILHLKHIDIWVLDVEGAEYSILQSTDFKAVHISFIVMECDNHSPETDTSKMNILKENGFRCKRTRGLGGADIQSCMCRNTKRFRASSITPGNDVLAS